MKKLLFLMFLLGATHTIKAQIEENLFEWQANNEIAAKDKFLERVADQHLENMPIYTFKECDITSDNKDSYRIKIKGIGYEKMFEDNGTYDFFEIYHENKMILRHISYNMLYDVRYITGKASNDLFIKVPLSNDSFALFFGGWFFPDGTPSEMVVVVVTGDTAKVVYDDYAYAYKYTPGENFAIEYVKEIEDFPITESILKNQTKYKIWKEGNMLKYKSWK